MDNNSQYALGRAQAPQAGEGKDSQLSLEVVSRGATKVVYCRGRIVFRADAGVLSERIGEIISNTRHLVLELSGIEMIDSAGLGELVVVLMWVQASGCSMKLAAPRRHIRQLLELTNLASVFKIYPTLEAAVSLHAQGIGSAGDPVSWDGTEDISLRSA